MAHQIVRDAGQQRAAARGAGPREFLGRGRENGVFPAFQPVIEIPLEPQEPLVARRQVLPQVCLQLFRRLGDQDLRSPAERANWHNMSMAEKSQPDTAAKSSRMTVGHVPCDIGCLSRSTSRWALPKKM